MTEVDTRQELVLYFRRIEEARKVGGIPLMSVVEGKPIPEGWQFDPHTQYYIPSNVTLF